MIPFIGQIIMFGGNFAPRTWALCDGQLLSISANSALFSILGTTFGGDGRTTFALPDLRGRIPLGAGQGPGLSFRPLGQLGGFEQNTHTQLQLPQHSHPVMIPVSDEDPTDDEPNGKVLGVSNNFTGTPGPNQSYGQNLTTGPKGSGLPVNNIMPGLVVNYIIALQGTYPSRN